MDKRCEFVGEDGRKCKAWKISNSKHCFTHTDDPEIKKMRQEALRKAADSKKLYLPITQGEGEVSLNLPKVIDLEKSKGIRKAYITIIKAAAAGAIDERKLGALVYALNGYINAIDKIDLLERIEALERIANQRSIDYD